MSTFYGNMPTLDNFKSQLLDKQENFTQNQREILVSSLVSQYGSLLQKGSPVDVNIQRLALPNTFTITTGHQLNLMTGPLYFLYKIISTLNLCKTLKKEHPEFNFVPVYWMATEDHDFDEISFFNFNRKNFKWDREKAGAVGRFSLDGLEPLFALFDKELGSSSSAQEIKNLIKKSYLSSSSLTEATRKLMHELFQPEGLVILDGDDRPLKQVFIPKMKEELLSSSCQTEVEKTISKLQSEYDSEYVPQVNPREINLFYIVKGIRERIIEEEGSFKINNTSVVFSKEELLKELEEFPERFSPNALLRPLYQEVVLPNLCYVGGGGELAYWFQLKDYFKSVAVTFPILLLRNSVLLVPKKLSKKLKKLNETIEALFLNTHDLENRHTQQLSKLKINFSPQREHLRKQFEDLYVLAKQTDSSFLGAVGAQEKKQLNGLDHLEKRLLKAEKKKLKDQIQRLISIQDYLFPNGSLQERRINFSEF